MMIPWGLILRIALPVAALLAAFVFGRSTGSASVQREWDRERAVVMAQHAADLKAAREQESAWRRKVDDANRAAEQDRARHARIVAGLRADGERLRGAIAAFAAGGADDSAAACRDRASTLGRLLDQALRTGAECAGGAEAASGDLRRVLGAWPVTTAAPGL